MNPLLKRYEKNKNNRGRRSEKRVAAALGTRPNPGSGALPGLKGDVTRPEFIIELKATKNKSFLLEKKILNKIDGEAKGKYKVPALGISFTDELGGATPNGDWMMVPLWFFRNQGW